MNEQTLRENLKAYIDGELPHNERKQIEAEIRANPALQAECEALRALTHQVQAVEEPKADAVLHNSILLRLRDEGLLPEPNVNATQKTTGFRLLDALTALTGIALTAIALFPMFAKHPGTMDVGYSMPKLVNQHQTDMTSDANEPIVQPKTSKFEDEPAQKSDMKNNDNSEVINKNKPESAMSGPQDAEPAVAGAHEADIRSGTNASKDEASSSANSNEATGGAVTTKSANQAESANAPGASYNENGAMKASADMQTQKSAVKRSGDEQNQQIRAVVKNASARIAVDDIASALEAIDEIVKANNGTVSVKGEGDDRVVTCLVPSEKFEAVFDSLNQVGVSLERNLSYKDVTETQTILSQEIAANQTEIDKQRSQKRNQSRSKDTAKLDTRNSALNSQLNVLNYQSMMSRIKLTLNRISSQTSPGANTR